MKARIEQKKTPAMRSHSVVAERFYTAGAFSAQVTCFENGRFAANEPSVYLPFSTSAYVQ